MNRIIITARSAKGLTETEVAKELKIDENLYKEIELGISAITSEMAETFESLYNVPAYYFTTPYSDNIQTSIYALEKMKEILTATPDIQNISVPADTHLSIAKMGLDALIAKEEQILLLMQIKELTAENKALKELYEAKSK
ncbi:MAG: helix-turn-helix domain-containing protein [Ginsengibacter sp.]